MLNFIRKVILILNTEFASMSEKPDVPRGFDEWEDYTYFIYTYVYFF